MFAKHFALGMAVTASTCGGTDSSDTLTPSERTEVRLWMESPNVAYNEVMESHEASADDRWRQDDDGAWLGEWGFSNFFVVARYDAELAEIYGIDGFDSNGSQTIDMAEYPEVWEVYVGFRTEEGVDGWLSKAEGTVEIEGCPSDGFYLGLDDVSMEQLSEGWFHEISRMDMEAVLYVEPTYETDAFAEANCW